MKKTINLVLGLLFLLLSCNPNDDMQVVQNGCSTESLITDLTICEEVGDNVCRYALENEISINTYDFYYDDKEISFKSDLHEDSYFGNYNENTNFIAVSFENKNNLSSDKDERITLNIINKSNKSMRDFIQSISSGGKERVVVNVTTWFDGKLTFSEVSDDCNILLESDMFVNFSNLTLVDEKYYERGESKILEDAHNKTTYKMDIDVQLFLQEIMGGNSNSSIAIKFKRNFCVYLREKV